MALFLDIAPGDELRIGDGAVVTLEYKSGRRARLRITGAAVVELVKDPQQPTPQPARQAGGLDGRRT